MEAREAIAALEPLKSTFKSLEKLSEVLETVARVESQVGQLETAKVRLGRDIEALKQKRAEAEDEFKTFEMEQIANRERVRDKVNAEITEFREDAKKKQRALEIVIDGLNQAKDKLAAEHTSRKSQMDAEIEARKKELDDLNQVIADTRARLKGIG